MRFMIATVLLLLASAAPAAESTSPCRTTVVATPESAADDPFYNAFVAHVRRRICPWSGRSDRWTVAIQRTASPAPGGPWITVVVHASQPGGGLEIHAISDFPRNRRANAEQLGETIVAGIITRITMEEDR